MRCPSCQGPLQIHALTCQPCELRIEGRISANEFAHLSGDSLHLLRIFVSTEGSIRDMESSLGLSYPTIKNRLAQLKRELGLDSNPESSPDPISHSSHSKPSLERGRSGPLDSVDSILAALEAGQLTAPEATKLIKLRQTKGSRK